MKEFYYTIMIFLYILGVVGGIGYAAYNQAYVIVIGIAALAYLAFPKVKEYVKLLIN